MQSVIIALVFNFLDMVSGLLSAIKNRSLKSNKLRDGLFKKFGFVILYVLSFLLDNYKNEIGLNIPFSVLEFIIVYVVVTEIVSILENLIKINENIVPKKLIQFFKEIEVNNNERY